MSNKICPICKKHRLILGGQVAVDGTFCIHCWNKAIDKSNSTIITKMTLNEIKNFINEDTTGKTHEEIFKHLQEIIDNRHLRNKEMENVTNEFKESYVDFFNCNGIKKNSKLQNIATQFFWHILVLKKNRLDNKNITFKPNVQRKNVSYILPINVESSSDGKYDVSLIHETVTGSNEYFANKQFLYQENSFNFAKYRTIETQKIGKDIIICPSCGNKSTRDNLLDGCDYCETKFSIEDLGVRVNEFNLTKNLDVHSGEILDDAYTIKRSGSKFCVIASIISIIFIIFSIITGKIKPNEIFSVILSATVGIAILTVLWKYLFSIIFSSIISVFVSVKGGYEQNGLFVKEQMRHDIDVLTKIKDFDPLFSAEGFYSEITNMITAIAYANKSKEISAFFDEPNDLELNNLIQRYKDVIHFVVDNMHILNYEINDNYQKMTVNIQTKIVKYENLISNCQENLIVKFIKNKECKTQSVCALSFLRCSKCGSSLSLLDGAFCHACNQPSKLADKGWAIHSYQIK